MLGGLSTHVGLTLWRKVWIQLFDVLYTMAVMCPLMLNRSMFRRSS